jgi:hypothetical protein
MKNILILFVLTLASCNFDKKSSDAATLTQDSLTEGMIGGAVDTLNKNMKIVQNNYDITKDTVALPPQVKKALKKSTLKEKTCDEILVEYENLIKSIKSNPKSPNVSKLALYANDPFYNNCYNAEKSFREKVDKLDLILEEI